jgi:hypothetical protein
MADLLRLLKLAGGRAVAGNCAVGLMGLAVHPPGIVQTPLLLAASLAGGSAGYLRWRAQSRPSSLHGSAAFGSQREARRELSGEGLIVGRADAGWLMRYAGPAHLLTIAPTRAGKGVGAIIPNLLTADRASARSRRTAPSNGRWAPEAELRTQPRTGRSVSRFNGDLRPHHLSSSGGSAGQCDPDFGQDPQFKVR